MVLAPSHRATAASERAQTRAETGERALDTMLTSADSAVRYVLGRAAASTQLGQERVQPEPIYEVARSLLVIDISGLTPETTHEQRRSYDVALLMLSMPGAARALREERAGKGSRENRKLLCAFNHQLGEMIGDVPRSMLPTFASQFVDHSLRVFGERGIPSLKREEFAEIHTGVSCELAVVSALEFELPDGWEVRSGTVDEDMQGGDIVITNPKGDQLWADIKGNGKFKFELERLMGKPRERGGINREEAHEAMRTGYLYHASLDQRGYATEDSVCMVRADVFGEVKNYELTDSTLALKFVSEQFAEETQT